MVKELFLLVPLHPSLLNGQRYTSSSTRSGTASLCSSVSDTEDAEAGSDSVTASTETDVEVQIITVWTEPQDCLVTNEGILHGLKMLKQNIYLLLKLFGLLSFIFKVAFLIHMMHKSSEKLSE